MDSCCYVCSTPFSIYVEMDRQLSRRKRWRAAAKGSSRFDLLLGDRFAIKYETLRGAQEWGRPQLVNYFRGSHLLTLKSAMLRRFREFFGSDIPGWMPESYILLGPSKPDEAGKPDKPWKKKKGAFTQAEMKSSEADRESVRRSAEGGGMWIAKPSSGCGGGGIVVSRDVEEAIAAVDSAPGSVYLLQRYIERPLLYKGGRKFDLRCWVLVTGDFRVFLFSQGSFRTSSLPYDRDDVSSTAAHITNHCLQQKCEEYGRYEEGNEVWYSAFDEWLADAHPGRSVEGDVLPQVRQIVMDSLRAVREMIEMADSPPPYLPFQLFGYDFLLDEEFKVWLLEINGSPASAERWKERMVSEMLAVAVDPAFPAAADADTAAAAADGDRACFDEILMPVPP